MWRAASEEARAVKWNTAEVIPIGSMVVYSCSTSNGEDVDVAWNVAKTLGVKRREGQKLECLDKASSYSLH